MSEYEKFFGTPVNVEIAGVKFQMKPLTVGELDLLSKLENQETRPKAIKEILIKALIPKITPEQVDKISMKHFPEILKKIMEINGLDIPKDATIPPEA